MVEYLYQMAADAAGSRDLNRDPVDDQPVDAPVPRDQVGRLDQQQLADGFVDRGVGKTGVQPFESRPQASGQDGLSIVVAFGEQFSGRDVAAMPNLVPEPIRPEPVEHQLLDDRLGDPAARHA